MLQREIETELHRVTAQLVHLMVSDRMIGFHFRGVNAASLVDLEYRHALRMLGLADPIEDNLTQHKDPDLQFRRAHQRHRIASAHFDRRKVLHHRLLEQSSLPAELIARWLQQSDNLRSAIVSTEDPCG